jgi:hypothetical protein
MIMNNLVIKYCDDLRPILTELVASSLKVKDIMKEDTNIINRRNYLENILNKCKLALNGLNAVN